MEEKLLFTPAAVLDFLTNIEELKGYEISLLSDSDDADKVMISIGDSTYSLQPTSVVNIPVNVDTIDEVNYAEEDALFELSQDADDVDTDTMTEVESSLLKSVAKTLAIGGLVCLTSKLLSSK